MLWLLLACSGTDKTPATDDTGAANQTYTGNTDDTSVTDDSGETGDTGDTDTGKADDTATDDTGGTSGLLALTGLLSATVGTDQSGTAYIGLFDQDPLATQGVLPVSGVQLAAIDLSGGATVAYRIENVTPTSNPYFLVGFLDVDENASQGNGGPDEGDLLISNSSTPLSVICLDTASCTLDAVFDFESGPAPQ